ncbi:uncharacterized protein [Epargyreus clarus]|uniref:uncharacterized protein n=1 Tax=Epargyreus clarus TaxID=520877 RepID=UPI003C2CFC4F
MSRHASHERLVTISDTTEVLEIIREEQNTPVGSSTELTVDGPTKEETPKIEAKPKTEDKPSIRYNHIVCPCKNDEIEKQKARADDLEKMLRDKEEELKTDFQQRMEKEIKLLKERFDFILHNEQTRASYMLREAHRERKEKIMALQRQLECKNLAGLMYVLASERQKSKLEILRITEQYTTYIRALQDLLSEGQALILHLSRGYKTAARVDHEWRQKMQQIMKQFQNFVYHFAGGTPDTNQYFFNMPDLLKIQSPVVDNPKEDPCDVGEEETVMEEELPREKTWWEMLESENRPFVMFGDMADFQASQRREVLRSVKAAKTAPKKWKEYVFNEMFLKSTCPNADTIKDEYFKHLPVGDNFECQTVHNQEPIYASGSDNASRRVTTASIDIRGNMGSILKIFAANNPQPVTKATLLGARDSMEIASTTRLREKHNKSFDHSKVVLNIGSRRTSMFEDIQDDNSEEVEYTRRDTENEEEDYVNDDSTSNLGSLHNDSLQVIPAHVPDHDHKINYEKVCPIEKCQHLQVDSFIRSLPPYMRASPFTHFEQTYDEYEPCSPEQLEILKRRIEDKRKKERVDFELQDDNPLDEWTPSVEGVAIQTSELSMSLPPCTCRVPSPTPASSTQRVFTLSELIPLKQELDKINQECFYNEDIEFDRFKVIGQDSREDLVHTETEQEFRRKRYHDIQKVLKQHPSLCEIFQGNIRC